MIIVEIILMLLIAGTISAILGGAFDSEVVMLVSFVIIFGFFIDLRLSNDAEEPKEPIPQVIQADQPPLDTRSLQQKCVDTNGVWLYNECIVD